ncbi:hypothetical protein CFC21_033674 [Triticum aestivum]|uniref:Uncharacterized protein n=3 Tax=Triticum TaxID=4564 RepID=A0A9R0R9W8_TRITD|nr:hypothetical protein CFC21_033674 [Triticum aestivum]VAH56115.1 unnamed protein product [Triticum turgidum subsp. durum]
MPELQTAFASGRSYCFGFLYSSLIGYVQLAALIACIVMSSLRLKRQDYVDAQNQEDDDHKNIRQSLNIFYALVLSQCILYFVSAIVASPLKRMFVVCLKYKLGVWGFLAIARYLQECLLKCISGDLHEAVNMDLVSFAKQKLTSNALDDQLLGIRILDHLLRIKEHKAMVLTKIRSSLDTVEKAVYMLGLKKEVEQDTRGHAARVLLEVAPDLQVESFPGIFQSISSLIITHKATISGSFSNSIRVSTSKELTLLGVDILNKLLTNPENCVEAKNAKNMLSKILDITNCWDEKTLDSNIDKIIVENSLNVLRKLVSTAGETGEELRCQVAKNIHTIQNIRKFFIDYAESQPAMLAQAADILACLALNDSARKEIERSHLIIWKLISLLAEDSDEGQESSLRVSTGVKMSAVEALVLLSAPINENAMLNAVSGRSIMAILSETKLQDMQRIVSTLFEESAEHRIMVARFLQNLRGYQGPHYGGQLEIVNKALPKEMEALMINEQGKLLESFIGLCMQICTSGNAKQFTNALRSAEITYDMFVQMLRKILELYKSPSSDAPGIRRVVIQQMNWMMARDNKYIDIFLRHEMDKALKEVAQTALKLENYWFFRFDVGTFEHDQSIYSLLSISPLLQAGGSGL